MPQSFRHRIISMMNRNLGSGRVEEGPLSICFIMQSHGVKISDFDLKELTNQELVVLQNRVSNEIQTRLLLSDIDSNSVGSYSVIDPPTVGSSSASPATGLRVPYSCGFKCKWCEAACTRRVGHTHHSCYYCRRRRG